MKAEFLDRRLGVELDVYQLDWSDIVIPQVVSKIDGREIVSATGVNVNAGDATVKGIELAVLARPFSGLELNIGASFSDPKYDRAQVETFGDFPSFAPTGDVSGNQILRTSKVQANAGLQYSKNTASGNEIFFRSDVSHRGRQFADASNQTIVPAATFVNASLGMRAEEWSVEVWGRNLTDEDAPTGAFRDAVLSNTLPNGNYSTGTFLPFRYSVSHPRRTTYGVTLRYNF
jgi:iron complex outermembrane receptor protein